MKKLYLLAAVLLGIILVFFNAFHTDYADYYGEEPCPENYALNNLTNECTLVSIDSTKDSTAACPDGMSYIGSSGSEKCLGTSNPYETVINRFPLLAKDEKQVFTWQRRLPDHTFELVTAADDNKGCRIDEAKGVDGYCWPALDTDALCTMENEELRFGHNEDGTVNMACIGDNSESQSIRATKDREGQSMDCSVNSASVLVGNVIRKGDNVTVKYECNILLDE